MDIFITILLIILILAGIVIAAMNLPGIWLVWFSLFLQATRTDFQMPTSRTLIIVLFLSLIISLIDNVVTPIGAKKFNSSKWGILGAIAGSIVGILMGGPIGLILGPLVGATLFEILFDKKDLNKALHSGIGAMLGLLVGVVLKFGLTLGLGIWAITVLL